MFVEHNVRTFNEPPDFEFEPSMIWHDTDEIVVDDPAQVFLRNTMTKARRSLDEIKPDLEKKRKEVEGLKARKEEVKVDETKCQVDGEVTKVCYSLMMHRRLYVINENHRPCLLLWRIW